ncbi:uncharacterized protein LOC109716312 isoform X1 [Ananas comosus]|uniref:Uncharacterized protein LOC109716312 isoform X1 n=1 Tax=Ananas comosus TaxID=4615 RepID=A0A6P5FUS0_ANACO|nr:uncharacterized protein LOC109716312 isoform X1 [Ananas comosus]XP_020097259.1 uncharacterized protein LOC109716312 isoform X1 [Ananas comosus]XP_020097260.1 uncharacterized protein LOC109716312 isoform X1 [Ananas comosus]XP_020097261.1 uncharacterized protein LOC109716312 isoform X1 [Ananas comosus]XP_020097262.1 uncharacterized protein LOC109716312 isoform X1 [Ananas comosus]
MDPCGVGGAVAVFVLVLSIALSEAAVPTLLGRGEGIGGKGIGLEGEELSPWAKGLLKLTSGAPGPEAMAPDGRFPLILASKRTRRPDALNSFKLYEGGWNITNKHYWASVAFTGAPGVVLAALWFVSFGVALFAHFCCTRRRGKEKEGCFYTEHISLVLLLIFTCAASIGCILLSIGQGEFHNEALNTLDYVVNQSDFTVQILMNVTDFLFFAKTINVEAVHLPLDVQDQIDKLSGDLNDAASALSEKTNENAIRIRRAVGDVRYTLIAVASLMLVLALVGFVLAILRFKHTIYIFAVSGWLLVAITFVLFGIFVIIESAAADTCTAMDEWVRYPHAETALSSILPCVDERTTNQTLYQSKEVVRQLVNIVNTAIYSTTSNSSSHFNQSGPPVPYLCSPYDSQLNDRPCEPWEVSITNASVVWQNYTCRVSDSGSCTTAGQITPDTYSQLETAANVSYALYHYAPLLLNLQDCKFVRDTFSSLTTRYCPRLDLDLRLVCTGLALIAVGVLLCLILWIFVYANRPQREEVFVRSSSSGASRIAPVTASP